MPTSPILKLRRIIWPDGSTSIDPEDYDVIDDRGERVGRMYRTIAVGGGEAWRWTVYCVMVGDHPPAGIAPTREAAAPTREARKQGWNIIDALNRFWHRL